MESFATIVNSFQMLIIFPKFSILDFSGGLVPASEELEKIFDIREEQDHCVDYNRLFKFNSLLRDRHLFRALSNI